MKALLPTLLAIALLSAPGAAVADETPGASLFGLLPYETPEQRAERVLQLANAGDAVAQSRLAILYRSGSGVEQSDELALQWLQKAAESGDPAAQHYLGLFYLSGVGTEVDLERASYWLRRCAEIDQPESTMSLAWFALEVNRIEGLTEQSVALARNGAEQGLKSAEEALTLLREEQAQAEEDGELWLRRSAASGNREAQYQLAAAIVAGRITAESPGEAVSWFLRAAEQGDARAMRRIGVAYLAGRGVERDRATAYQWFWLAMQRGDSMASEDVGHLDALLDAATRATARERAKAWEQQQDISVRQQQQETPARQRQQETPARQRQQETPARQRQQEASAPERRVGTDAESSE